MQPASDVRIDKYLWAVRLYKTRSLGSEACRAGHISIGGHAVKPSRNVRIGDVIVARMGEITRTIRVLALLERRVGSKVADQYVEAQTPASEYLKLIKKKEDPAPSRPKGA